MVIVLIGLAITEIALENISNVTIIGLFFSLTVMWIFPFYPTSIEAGCEVLFPISEGIIYNFYLMLT